MDWRLRAFPFGEHDDLLDAATAGDGVSARPAGAAGVVDVAPGEHDDLLDAATGTAYLLDRPEPRVW